MAAKRKRTPKAKRTARPTSLPQEIVDSDRDFRAGMIAEAEAFAAELAEFARAARGERPDGYEGLPEYLWKLRDSRRRYLEIERDQKERRAAGFPRNPPHYDHREVFAMLARGLKHGATPTSAHEQAALDAYPDAWLVFVELYDAINANTDASRRRLRSMLQAADASLREEPERHSPETPKGTERQRDWLLDPDLWAATTKRPKVRIEPSRPERLHAAAVLHGELHNYLVAGGRGEFAMKHMVKLLDWYREYVLEPESAGEMARQLVHESWAAVNLGAKATREQVLAVASDARDFRGLHYTKWRAESTWFKGPVAEPVPFDVEGAADDMLKILRPRKGPGRRQSAKSQAVAIYGVLAKGSAAGVQPDRNSSRSRVAKLIEALKPRARR